MPNSLKYTLTTNTAVELSTSDLSIFANNPLISTIHIETLLGTLRDFTEKFIGCTGLTKFTMNTGAMDNITKLDKAFIGCIRLSSIQSSGFTAVTSATRAFEGCSSLVVFDGSKMLAHTPAQLTDAWKDCTALRGFTYLNLDNEVTVDTAWVNTPLLTNRNTVPPSLLADDQLKWEIDLNVLWLESHDEAFIKLTITPGWNSLLSIQITRSWTPIMTLSQPTQKYRKI